MTAAEVVETAVTVKNSPIRDFTHSDDDVPPNYKSYCFVLWSSLRT